jgi:hypothetical protein
MAEDLPANQPIANELQPPPRPDQPPAQPDQQPAQPDQPPAQPAYQPMGMSNSMGHDPQFFMGHRPISMGYPSNSQRAIDQHHWNSLSSNVGATHRFHSQAAHIEFQTQAPHTEFHSQAPYTELRSLRHIQIPTDEPDPLITVFFLFLVLFFIFILNMTVVKIKTFIF